MDEKTKGFVDPEWLETLLKESKVVAESSFQPRGDEETKKIARHVLLCELDKEAKMYGGQKHCSIGNMSHVYPYATNNGLVVPYDVLRCCPV